MDNGSGVVCHWSVSNIGVSPPTDMSEKVKACVNRAGI